MNDTKDIAIAKWMSQLLTQRLGSGLEIKLSIAHWTISKQGSSSKIVIQRNMCFYSLGNITSNASI